eukprot:9896147-Alexandrium_andersonii.AAC.1
MARARPEDPAACICPNAPVTSMLICIAALSRGHRSPGGCTGGPPRRSELELRAGQGLAGRKVRQRGARS